MRNLKTLLFALMLLAPISTGALAQCGTQAPANKFCGNDTGSPALATWKTVPPGALTPIGGGTVLGNPTSGSAAPIATIAPVLGIPGSSQGQIGFAGATSGTAVLRGQSVAGSAVNLLPTSAGTLVSTGAAPLAIDAVTGQISITGLAGGVLAGAGPAFTMTPALGATGVATGSIAFNGFTSGSVVLTPQSAAGTPVITFPTTSGTLASSASSPLVLNATTGVLTCPTCVTSSGGGAITGTAPISVSAAGVVSINAPYTTLVASNGGIVYSGSTNLAILAGTATARQMLQSGASTTPAWSTTTWPTTTTINRILFSSSANVISEITTANGGLLNTSSGGVPSITATPVLGVAGTTVGSLGFQNATSGTITLQAQTGALGTVTVTLPAATTQLVGRDTTDTLTNKTIGVSTTIAMGADNIVGLAITGAGGNGRMNLGTTAGAIPFIRSQNGTALNFGINTTDSVFLESNGVFGIGVAGSILGNLKLYGSTSGSTTLIPQVAASGTLTLPSATDTLVGKATTDTFTNKFFNSSATGNTLQVSGVTVSAGQYPGEPSTANAVAGNVGEFVSSTVLLASAVTLTSATAANITSISLTAGDWDIWGNIDTDTAGTTDVTQNAGWISATSATLPTAPNNGSFSVNNYPAASHVGFNDHFPAGTIRVQPSTTTTYFLSGRSIFTVSTQKFYGFIGARRRR